MEHAGNEPILSTYRSRSEMIRNNKERQQHTLKEIDMYRKWLL
jgi:hypothetical protein